MRRLSSVLPLASFILHALDVHASPRDSLAPKSGWQLIQNGTTGITAVETVVISPTLALLFDRVQDNPLKVNGHPAWGAIWNFETNTVTPLEVTSDTFCASGGFLSNGTMVSVGGMSLEPLPDGSIPATDGRMLVRMMEPCEDPNGVGCHIIEDPEHLVLAETRWYPTAIRVFDGSLFVAGGIHDWSLFYNTDPVNSFEFFPPKDNGVPRPSPFLARSVPANLFPRLLALPDGKIFMVANNRSSIYDIETNTETPLPDLPNGVRVANPLDGTATLLPLYPPHYIPEVLVCGGTNISDTLQSHELSSQDPASDQCSRMTLTKQGIKKGWVVEKMLGGRIMPEMLLLPDGKVMIINGGRTGYAAYLGVKDPVGASNADNPAFTPEIYTPDAPLGKRFSSKGLPTSNIARLYHATATLTPSGNIFIAGSNPNGGFSTVHYPTELRVEYLNPPYMTAARPVLHGVPKRVAFNQDFTVSVNIPAGLEAKDIKLALIDLGFSTHAFHSSSRIVFLEATLSNNRKTIKFTTPPNNRVYPPGPAYIYLTVDGVTSVGTPVLVGNGRAPPVADQGVPLKVLL